MAHQKQYNYLNEECTYDHSEENNLHWHTKSTSAGIDMWIVMSFLVFFWRFNLLQTIPLYTNINSIWAYENREIEDVPYSVCSRCF